MGMYNYLTIDIQCPRCAGEICVDSEFRFGLLDISTYKMGDKIKWSDAKGKGLREPKKIPEGGNFVGLGYVECSACGKDFFVDIFIKDDGFSDVSVSEKKDTYHDENVYGIHPVRRNALGDNARSELHRMTTAEAMLAQ